MQRAKRIAVRKMRSIFPEIKKVKMEINGHKVTVVRKKNKIEVMEGYQDAGVV